MNQPDKIRVAVLYGGRSAEHEVSLKSAANVIQYLDQSRFEVIPIGIDKQGYWLLGKDIFMQSLEHNQVPRLADNQTWFSPAWIGTSVAPETKAAVQTGKLQFDVVFPVMHGTYCEDGTLQGLLELANIPYVGCGVLSSALCMDKDVSKRLAQNAGIQVPSYVIFKRNQWDYDYHSCIRHVAERLTYPVFVKPVNAGSSIGVTKVLNESELKSAVDEAFKYDRKVIIEKGLNVIELEIAVLEALNPNADPIVSVVGEVKPNHSFYSYDAKYLDSNGASLHIPADIPDNVKEQAQFIAKEIFGILECEGLARVDLFFDKDSKQLFFNEINTLPGFTQISMYPKLLEASGIPYSDLLTHLIQLALNRFKIKNQLTRSYAE